MHIDCFNIDGTTVQLTDDSYTETYASVEYTQTTEAGTTRRDTSRVGFLSALDIKITADENIKRIFDSAVKSNSISLTLYDAASGAAKTWSCYISSYSAELLRDLSSGTLWNV